MSAHPQCPQWCVHELVGDDFTSHYSVSDPMSGGIYLQQSFGGEGGDDAEATIGGVPEALPPTGSLTIEQAGRLAAELIAAIELAAAG